MDQQEQSGWRPTRGQLLWAGIILGLAFLLIVICGYLFGWNWTGLPKRTLWDWLDLLIVPIVLALGGYLFTRSENRRVQVIAEQRRQDDMLQGYLDQVGQLLLDKDNQLRDRQKGVEARTLARGRTYTVLGILEGRRKRTLLEFLYASYLIGRTRIEEDPSQEQHVIYLWDNDLSKAALKCVHLEAAWLRGVNLRAADLSEAHLSKTDLSKADLGGANLRGAILAEAQLRNANLEQADIRDADLRHADLRGAKLEGANLEGADLSGASLFDAKLRNVDLRSAKLLPAPLALETVNRGSITLEDIDDEKWERSVSSRYLSSDLADSAKEGALITDLTQANLEQANLEGADLRYANLCKTNLQGADLTGANLKGAMERIAEQHTREAYFSTAPPPGDTVSLGRLSQAASLKGATMPNGQKYENWVKDRRENKENGGPA